MDSQSNLRQQDLFEVEVVGIIFPDFATVLENWLICSSCAKHKRHVSCITSVGRADGGQESAITGPWAESRKLLTWGHYHNNNNLSPHIPSCPHTRTHGNEQ